jgi:hypothetical protein
MSLSEAAACRTERNSPQNSQKLKSVFPFLACKKKKLSTKISKFKIITSFSDLQKRKKSQQNPYTLPYNAPIYNAFTL